MIHRILVPLDGSSLAETSLASALAVSSAFDAELIVHRVVENGRQPAPISNGMHWRFLRAEALAYLNRVKDRCTRHCRTCEVVVSDGDPAEEILQCGREHNVDLIVLSTHGRGYKAPFRLGNTVQQVISAAGVSVMIVPVQMSAPKAATDAVFRRILVPLDGSRRAEWALCLAGTIAATHGSTLHVVHVVPVPEMARRFPPTSEEEELCRQVVQHNRKATREYLDEIESRFEGEQLHVHSHLLVSPQIAKTIQQVVEEQHIDLLVGCAHGHTGGGEWLYGGIAGSLIAHATVPLLIFQDLQYEARKTGPCEELTEERLLERAP
jgi:nucleotide-binding universal stress UspA family protein